MMKMMEKNNKKKTALGRGPTVSHQRNFRPFEENKAERRTEGSHSQTLQNYFESETPA